MGARTASPLPEPTGARSLPRRRCAALPERAADGLGGAPGALKQARDVAGALCGREERRGVTSGSRSLGGAPGSQSITDSCGLVRGHPGIELRRCPPLDPLRCDSAPKPSSCATGEISPASFPVSAARWPTRRTACSFSLAVSLGDDGLFARVARPALSAVLSWLLPPRRGPPGELVGVSPRPSVPAEARACARAFSTWPPRWCAAGEGSSSGCPVPTATPWRSSPPSSACGCSRATPESPPSQNAAPFGAEPCPKGDRGEANGTSNALVSNAGALCERSRPACPPFGHPRAPSEPAYLPGLYLGLR